MKNQLFFFVIINALCVITCTQKTSQENATTGADTLSINTPENEVSAAESNISKNGITLTPFKDSPDFQEAKLRISSPKETEKLSAGKIKFTFDVSNYELKSQTTDAGTKLCANSKDGQHIHFIVNDEPYMALYE